MLKNGDILKPFNALEFSLDDHMSRDNQYILPNAFLMESKLNLFKDVEKLNNAIQHWVKLHPLLSCHTRVDETSRSKNFVYLEHPVLNVEYLRYKPCGDTGADDDYWKLLFEYNTLKGFKSEIEEPSWKMKIIEDSGSFHDPTSVHRYWLILVIHHFLTDGRNIYAIILELFELIEQSCNGQLSCMIDDERRRLGEMEYNYPNDPRAYGTNKQYKTGNQQSQRLIYLKESLRPDSNFLTNSLKVNNGILLNLDGTLNMDIDEILKDMHKVASGFEFLKIKPQVFEKLIEKSKRHGAKMTMLLTLLTLKALSKTYRQFGISEEWLMASIPINMRQFLDPPLDYICCGNWTSRLLETFNENDLNVDADELFALSREKSKLFHERFDNNEQWKVLDDISAVFPKLKEGFDLTKRTAHVSFSNLGTQVPRSRKESAFCVKEYYGGNSFKFEGNNMLTQHILTTIDNTVYWTISYSKYEVKREFVKCWAREILNITQTYADLD